MDLTPWVSVITGTFGDSAWIDLAHERAGPSVPVGVPWIHAHKTTLGTARNTALEQVATPFVIGLDADDELPGQAYIDAMARGTADVRAPIVRFIRGGRARRWQPRVASHAHDCDASCLRAGNWIVIGACARTELLRRARFHDFGWSEDYATWALCMKLGASFELIRDAEYVAHVRADSRNRGAPDADRLAAHREIERFVWPEECAA